MTFLYPGFLWALLALAIPLLVHLFNFRKTQKIYFSNTRFIQQVQEATSSKRRLKHLLVLAARLLFIFFLVLVFAQPIIPAREQMKAGANLALYLDNSQSMSTTLSNETRSLDAGINVIRNIVENFPPDTRYRLITNDFDPFSNSLKTKNEVVDKLAQIRLSARSRTAEEVVNRFRTLGEEQDVFWVSDFQQSTFGNFINNDTTRYFHLVPIRAAVSSNVFVDTVYLQNPFSIGGERNTLIVRLFNDGTEERNQLPIRLVLDGLQSGTATVSLAPNTFGEIRFELPVNKTGASKAHLTFSDAPITFDNDFYSIINFSDRLTVFEIRANPQQRIIEKVFGNKTVFTFESTTPVNVNYSNLSKADLLVLNELNTMDAPLLQAVSAYLRAGGTLLLIPSDTPGIDSYASLVPGLSVSKQAQVLSLSKPDFKNPFFANIFQEQSVQLAMPVVRNSIEWKNDRHAILQQQDDKPYLSLFQNMGKVYLLGGPLHPEYGSFYLHALFVPILYRIAASGIRNQQALYTLLSQPIVSFRIDSVKTDQVVTLSGEEMITPSQRWINQQVVLDFAGIEMKAGNYAVTNKYDTVAWLAFNQVKEESKLRTLEEEAMVLAFGPQADVYAVDVQSSQAMEQALKENYQGIALWRYALVAALFCIVLEVLLLRFWKS